MKDKFCLRLVCKPAWAIIMAMHTKTTRSSKMLVRLGAKILSSISCCCWGKGVAAYGFWKIKLAEATRFRIEVHIWVSELNLNQMSNNPWVKRLLQDTQAMLTLSYALLILLGGVFDYFYYKRFGIDILNYSSIFDLLVEPFRKPTILLFFLGTVFFLLLIYFADAWWKTNLP